MENVKEKNIEHEMRAALTSVYMQGFVETAVWGCGDHRQIVGSPFAILQRFLCKISTSWCFTGGGKSLGIPL